MPAFLRRHAWRLSIALLAVSVLTAAFLFLRNSPSEAFPGMPSDQRAYWEWVSTINRDRSSALESGFALLEQHPQLRRSYNRIAEVCLELERAEDCRTSIALLPHGDAVSDLYRKAALAQLGGDPSAQLAAWKEVASSDVLDPALTRVIVDRARQNPDSGLLDELEESWSAALASDSSLAGAAFGLGYAAVLRSDWETAGPLLTHVAKLLPDDPQAYRELGRIYYFIGDYDGFTSVLEKGIESARRSYDLEQELVLRGNLGAGYLLWRGDLARASEMFEAALEQSRILSMKPIEADNLIRLANVRARQHKYDEALVLLDSAEVRLQEVAPTRISTALALRGFVYKNTFRFAEAEAVLKSALIEAREHDNPMNVTDVLVNLVQTKYLMGKYDEASQLGVEALEISTEYGLADYAIVSRVVLGELERLRGRYKAAQDHFNAGLEIAYATQNQARATELYKQLGMTALQIGDAAAAQTHFDRLLKDDPSLTDPIQKAEMLFWFGHTAYHFHNYTEAIRSYDLALDEIGARDTALKGSIILNKGYVLTAMGRQEEGIELLRKADSLIDENSPERYSLEVSLGHALVDAGRYAEALKRFDSADKAEEDMQWTSVHWIASYGRALAHWRQGKVREADRYFLDAISLIEALRDHIRDPEDRAFFIFDKIDVYDSYTAFLEEHGRSTEAFHYNERARSRTLVDLLYTTQQSRELDLTIAVDHAIELQRQRRSFEQALAGDALEGSSSSDGDLYRGNRAAYLRREIQRADSLYRNVQHNLFGTRKLYTFDPVAASEAMQLLTAEEAILVYNMRERSADTGNLHPVVYVLLTNSVISVPLDVHQAELAEAIKFFRGGISSPTGNTESWQRASRRLYDDILKDVLTRLPAEIRHLHIVPEGTLHYLPFAALMTPNGEFLIEKFSVSVVPSVTVLKLSRERNPRRWRSILLLADPDNRLPGARREVLSIVSKSPSRRHALLGREASQNAFEKLASNYDIIHFATHGNFNNRAPWNSHLELFDDVLSVDEIGKLSLDAYLVTLSACETALSSGLTADVPAGDEWVGFNQAFLAAGTPTVMASLWPIDDRVSSVLMVDFYERLGPEGKAVALAEAQRKLLQQRSTRNPFYWAAFTIVGDPL